MPWMSTSYIRVQESCCKALGIRPRSCGADFTPQEVLEKPPGQHTPEGTCKESNRGGSNTLQSNVITQRGGRGGRRAGVGGGGVCPFASRGIRRLSNAILSQHRNAKTASEEELRCTMCICNVHRMHRGIRRRTPCVTFRRVVVPLRGPGRSPVLPFACCVGSLLSVGRCRRCSCWCRFRVCGAQ